MGEANSPSPGASHKSVAGSLMLYPIEDHSVGELVAVEVR